MIDPMIPEVNKIITRMKLTHDPYFISLNSVGETPSLDLK